MKWLVDHFHDGNTNAAARDIGIAQPTLYHILSGRAKSPRADLVQKIAARYHLTTDWLLTGEGPGPAIVYALSPDEQKTMPLSMQLRAMVTSGRYQWLALLRHLNLADDAFAAWSFVPVEQISNGIFVLMNTSLFTEKSAAPEATHKQLLAMLDRAIDASYRAWLNVIGGALAHFSSEDLKRRMEQLTAEARLGFAGLAISIIKGVTTVAEQRLVLNKNNLGALNVADLRAPSPTPVAQPKQRGRRPARSR